jgi:hypothetical protein
VPGDGVLETARVQDCAVGRRRDREAVGYSDTSHRQLSMQLSERGGFAPDQGNVVERNVSEPPDVAGVCGRHRARASIMEANKGGIPLVALAGPTARVGARYHAFVIATQQARRRLDIVPQVLH